MTDVWQAIAYEPTVPFDGATLRRVVRDQRRWSRRWLYPWLRHLSRLAVAFVKFGKLFLGGVRAHTTLDRLCIWFLRRFVSPEAGALLLRHFVVETNLLNFVVANTGRGLREVSPRPVRLDELGDGAVIQHDVNVYDVLIALGLTPWTRPAELDFGMLDVPAIDVEPHRRRWLNLDIQSALCLMNIPFAACLTRTEYERAVHSMVLDDTLLTVLSELTGDTALLRWRRGAITCRVDTRVDVPRAVYEHAVICEYAHERLRQLAYAAAENRRTMVA